MLPKSLIEGNSEFCVTAAEFLSRCSQIAYLDPFLANGKFQMLGAKGVAPVFAGNHQAYAVFFEEFTVISVRGTEKDFADIRTDLQFELVPWGAAGGNVHKGFFEGGKALAPKIWDAVTRDWATKKPVYYTGHSLGGGLAQICAGLDDWNYYFSPVVYSFGAPRISDKLLSPELKTWFIHHRIVNGADIVPNLPFLSMGFVHTEQTKAYLSSSGKLYKNPSVWRCLIDQAWDVATGIFEGFTGRFPVRRFTRHRIAGYVTRLQKALQDG